MTTKVVLYPAYAQQSLVQHIVGTLTKDATPMELFACTNVLLMKGNPATMSSWVPFFVRSRVDGQEVSWVYGRLRIESVGWTALVPFHSIPVLPRKDSSAPS